MVLSPFWAAESTLNDTAGGGLKAIPKGRGWADCFSGERVAGEGKQLCGDHVTICHCLRWRANWVFSEVVLKILRLALSVPRFLTKPPSAWTHFRAQLRAQLANLSEPQNS